MSENLLIPFPLRHQCTGCGASCNGLKVHLRDEAEMERVRQLGVKLAVEGPVVDGSLRQIRGRCAFLDDLNRCRIHATVGYEAKPVACRMYPMVMVRAEDGVRVGIDPGCFDHVRSWRGGPPIPEGDFFANKKFLQEDQLEAERSLLDLCAQPGSTVAALLEAMATGRPDGGPGLPSRFGGRLLTRAKEALPQLDAVVDGDEAGDAVRAAWAAIRPVIANGDPENPPAWPALAPEEDAYAVNVLQRVLYLRLASGIPVVSGIGLLVLSGAVLCAWADPTREPFGRRLAAWTRLIRVMNFWLALTPDGETMAWLARGGE